jgi:hypothetical protein
MAGVLGRRSVHVRHTRIPPQDPTAATAIRLTTSDPITAARQSSQPNGNHSARCAGAYEGKSCAYGNCWR